MERMGDRRMASIFPECDQLKQNYDKCFTEFFQKFISSSYRHNYAVNPCDRLHKMYRDCVEQRLAVNKPFEIDLAEVQKEFLNTEDDKLRDSQEEK